MKRKILCLASLAFFLTRTGPSPAAPPPEISSREAQVQQVVRHEEPQSPYQVTGESIVLLLSKMVNFSLPGSSIVFERRSGQLFVKQTPAGHAMIENLLAELRRAAFRQVEIEARFVTVSAKDFRGVGVDFAGLNAALSKAGIVLGTAALGTPLAPAAGAFAGSTFLDFADTTGFGSTPLGQQLSFFGRSSKIDFRTVYDALETEGEVNTLSAPKITVFNNQRAHIRIEKIESYVSEVNATLASQAVGANFVAIVQTEAQVEQAQSGTILDVTPTVNQDGTITLELRPQFVTVDLTTTQTITNVTGGQTFPNTVTLPVFKGQEIRTTVTIPDGGVAVMGGLVQDEEDLREERVPFFGRIPLVGKAFSNEQVKRKQSYLLIFVQAREKGYRYENKG